MDIKDEKLFSLLWFDHSFVVELVGARALTAGLERSQNWLWQKFSNLRSLVVSQWGAYLGECTAGVTSS